jgi:NAD(P)-dependent dehydrogenase (short-subunit alcohol dehydrogenase family)
MLYKDKVVLITGAANGLGKAASLLFAKEGATVIMVDIDSENGKKNSEDINSLGLHTHFYTCNLAIEKEIANLMATIILNHKTVDVAINNAGIGGILAPTHAYPTSEFEKIMAVNSTGVFLSMKYELEHMVTQKTGVILNVSSAAGMCGMANNVAYTASKHAVIGMTKAAALEYAKHNIRINAICPSFTMTNMVEDLFERIGEGKEILRKNIPMKRFGEANEIAEAMVWLCSEKNTFMTGTAVPIDGGFLAT